VQNFLQSLGGGAQQPPSQRQSQLFTTLSDLLTPEQCISSLSSASPTYIDSLLSHLPPQILLLAQENLEDDSENLSADAETTEAAIAALSLEQKKDVLTRVFRSPQLHQSLGSLTMALRDGGLPMVSESLGIKVKNGGFARGSGMPLGDGAAVEAFLEGVKKTVEEEEKEGTMDTD
jgi:26S proteasome regulatory subunit N13